MGSPSLYDAADVSHRDRLSPDPRLARLHRLPVLRRPRRGAGRGGAARSGPRGRRSSTRSRCRARRSRRARTRRRVRSAPRSTRCCARARGRRRGRRRVHAVPPAAGPRRRCSARCSSALRARAPRAPIVLADFYQSGQHVVDAPLERDPRGLPRGRRRSCATRPRPSLAGARRRASRADGRPARPAVVDGGEPARLDALPLPAWDLVDLGAYFALPRARRARPRAAALGLPDRRHERARSLTSRGCPYRCVHCSSNPASRRTASSGRRRSGATRRAYLDRAASAISRARGVAARAPARRARQRERARTSTRCSTLLAEHDAALRDPERDARRLPRCRATSRR